MAQPQMDPMAWMIEDDVELSPVEEAVCALLDLVEMRHAHEPACEPCKLCGSVEHTDLCPVPALRYWLDVKTSVPDPEVEEWMRELNPN